MAERTSYNDSFAAALESEPLPPDASGAEGLPQLPPGSVSPATSSPPAGVLKVAASSKNDEHASAVPSPSTQQPPTSGDGVHDPEHHSSIKHYHLGSSGPGPPAMPRARAAKYCHCACM
jgi:hypothetical protein